MLAERQILSELPNNYHAICLFFIFRMVFVQCSLQFEFMAERYAGIVELQDALMRKGMLYSMPLKTQFLSSNHG